MVNIIVLLIVLFLIFIATFVYQEFANTGYAMSDFLTAIQIISGGLMFCILAKLIFEM
ncbi:putative membrane protein [Bacillus phage AR9]|uniref:Uncharacterized protein n=2 Tax=Bacillus phage PBS1 TaxID=10683 RepID=A0A223LDP0_BPPB1|nr:hypothetical protein BI022_gp178 [Bacillus phage AR9]YP_009664270.1 hypothetical protein FK780_gp068 [Bacillus phage PBS1]AMS01263.1 putative membrane protein [Bacillus phage AR9]AST99890.1 hypothetical protein PBI_PBS1_68 [Bacillus phage PBS1]BDE75290.1 hypothetical protein [Bacillus phage PBS1]